jgi:hypothetical protein
MFCHLRCVQILCQERNVFFSFVDVFTFNVDRQDDEQRSMKGEMWICTVFQFKFDDLISDKSIESFFPLFLLIKHNDDYYYPAALYLFCCNDDRNIKTSSMLY